MYNVKSKTCIYENCKTLPVYGLEIGKATHCNSHKTENMYDVKNKTCIYENCKSQPSYGTYQSGKIHCSKHFDKKTEWKLTTCSNCKGISIWSKTGNSPYEFCDNCVPDNYKSQLAGTCINCNLTNLLLDSDKKCLLSCSDIHKDRMKYSENEMLEKFKIKKWDFVNDKTVSSGCSLRRPDFIFDLGSLILIIENDENQHKSRPCECEQTRMIQIYQDYGGVPVHFIRFNPDKYKSNKVADSLPKRLSFLCDIITKIKKDKIFFTKYPHLSVSYLYYDNYDGIWSVDKIEFNM